MTEQTEERAQHGFRLATPEKLGRFGEALWARVFRGSGLHYIPLHKMTDQGAQCFTPQDWPSAPWY
jgi:hypothetical protein